MNSVFIISEASCSNAVKVDRQCFPDVKLFMCRRHHYLDAAVYIPQDANLKNVLQNFFLPVHTEIFHALFNQDTVNSNFGLT